MPTLREFCTRLRFFMVTSAGPLAMISCEPRQARKGATVAVTSCAGVRLAGEATSLSTPPIILVVCSVSSSKEVWVTPQNPAPFLLFWSGCID